jgi:hypothetical protein
VNMAVSKRDIERQIADLALAELDKAKEPDTFLNRMERYAAQHMRSLGFGSAVGILGIVALSLGGPAPKGDTSDDGLVVGSISRNVPDRSEWTQVQRPAQLLSLESVLLAGAKPSYMAFRSSGTALKDTLSFTPSQPRQPDMQLALHRNTQGAEVPSLLIDAIRTQAELGRAVLKSGQPDTIKSKFGPMETLDAQITGPDNTVRACLLFRSQSLSSQAWISGWYCPGESRMGTRPELACLLDRITLLKSGQDSNLRQFFVQAERNRQGGCATSREANGSRHHWLDSHARVPEMRSGLSGTAR